MTDYQYVVINKNKEKQKIIFFWDAKDLILISLVTIAVYFVSGLFTNKITQLVAALITMFLSGSLSVPVLNGLSVIAVIRRASYYLFKTPKSYYKIPDHVRRYYVRKKEK